MNKKYKIAGSLLLALTLPTLGQTVVTSMDSFGGNIDFTDTITLNQYNGNLADLASIEIYYVMDADGGTLGVDNEGDTEASISGSFGVILDVTGSSVDLLDGSFDPILDGFTSAYTIPNTTLGANDGDDVSTFDIGGSDYASFTSTGSSASGSGLVNDLFWSQYVGSGTFTIDFAVDSYFNLSGEGGSTIQFDSPDEAKGKVIVKYTLVPEPSSTMLLGLGGLLLMRRKR
ncbi:MAG: choice-of-anchor E domain-containing protein [Akkermansiaceae bacterium]